MRCSILIFDGFTALDVVGGYEVLANVPGMEVEFVATNPGIVAADTRRLGLVAYRALSDTPDTDILYVPGGPGVVPALADPELVGHLRRLSATATWTFAVCNGVALVGAAGGLKGRTVTTNWGWRDRIREYGAAVVAERARVDGSLVTGAGVSASIDAALVLAAQIAGEDVARLVRLGIEYYPRPPFDGESADTESEAARSIIRNFEATTAAERLRTGIPPFDVIATGASAR